MRYFAALLLTCFLFLGAAANGQNLGFDLEGPPVDVKVERGGHTLPISEVPNLQPGDRLWLHPDFPDSQSVHYLLVVAFLRGTTNPPPDDWFIKAETWDKSVRQEGIFVTVPKEAQQALVFLAPQATGDFPSLRAAVRGRPGAFVRSSQDLQQASFDRARIERYLAEIKAISEDNPAELQQRSASLARNLKIKLDEKCFDKPIEQQYSCLTHNPDQLILDDANSQSMLARVSTGATADLMNQISYSRLGGGGAYSAYVGAIIDFGRIMGSLHTAQYQYIPALALPRADSLSLRLNNPPSFRKPQSVIVVALPPVQPASIPTLVAQQPSETYCLGNSALVLPTEGPPLVFATRYAHDMFLRVRDAADHTAEIPLVADPARGGFALGDAHVAAGLLQSELTGTIHGRWGFDPFEGPTFTLHVAKPETWTVAANDRTALIVGREDLLHIEGQNTACISSIDLVEPNGATTPLKWKSTGTRGVELQVPLDDRKPSQLNILVSQYGVEKPDSVRVQSYEEAAQFDTFQINAGDPVGTLSGKRLDEVERLQLTGVEFRSGELARRTDHDELTLTTSVSTDDLHAGQATARVVLKDGRTFKLPADVLPPRPKVILLSKAAQSDSDKNNAIQLGSSDEFPSTSRIVFSLKTVAPATFPHQETIEVAASDGSFHTVLKMSDGSLVLQDSTTAIGMLDPEKTFGKSAFGALQFRAVSPDGTPGDWQTLGTLVRLPEIQQITCPKIRSKPCSLSGNDLFLLSAVSTDANFAQPTVVPDGFTGQALPVGRPSANRLFVSLRDDPDVTQTLVLPTVEDAPNSDVGAGSTSIREKTTNASSPGESRSGAKLSLTPR